MALKMVLMFCGAESACHAEGKLLTWKVLGDDMGTPRHRLLLEEQLMFKRQRSSSKGLAQGCWVKPCRQEGDGPWNHSKHPTASLFHFGAVGLVSVRVGSQQNPDKTPTVSLFHFGAIALVSMKVGSQQNPDKTPTVSLFLFGAIALVSMKVGSQQNPNKNPSVPISFWGHCVGFHDGGSCEKNFGLPGTVGPLVRFREINFKVEIGHPKEDEKVEVCFIEQPEARKYE